MKRPDFRELYRKYLSNEISRKELRQFFEYIAEKHDHKSQLSEIDKSVQEEESKTLVKVHSTSYKDELFDEIFENIEKKGSPLRVARNTTKKRWTWQRVAAALALLIVGGLMLYTALNMQEEVEPLLVKETRYGQKSTVTLSDGSVIKMNSGSKLMYPELFKGNVRKVILEGEAFFEIAHDPGKPFLIQSQGLTTTVLGTSFNVSAYSGEEVAIAVLTGNVAVTRNTGNGKDSVLLNSNEVMRYDAVTNDMTKSKEDVHALLSWKDGHMVFDMANLHEVGKMMEKWFGVTVVFENPRIGECYVDGTLINPSLEDVLEALTFTHQLYDYRFGTGNRVIFSGVGCDGWINATDVAKTKRSQQ